MVAAIEGSGSVSIIDFSSSLPIKIIGDLFIGQLLKDRPSSYVCYVHSSSIIRLHMHNSKVRMHSKPKSESTESKAPDKIVFYWKLLDAKVSSYRIRIYGLKSS